MLNGISHEWVNKQMGIKVPDYPFLKEGKEAHRIIQEHVRSSYTTEHIITERLLPQVIETLSLSTGMEDVEEAVDRDFLKREVKKVLSKLSDREAKVLKLRFGLEGNRQMNLEETGKVFGVTRERIRQIEAHALRKMRHIKNRGKLKAYL